MRVIHFTQGATDPLEGFDAKGVRFVPLADGRMIRTLAAPTSTLVRKSPPLR
jgi:hypothetical protein